jgi:site-specific DNA recombinase
MKRSLQSTASRLKPGIRCAIYTRKSTEEGLQQDFNSLDAQRESAEAYIASQKAEGWICVPDRYDDGGFTGGNLERPALQRLLTDIEADKIDCVVVYKVDRLSRSILDFSKIVERFEQYGVSFVSVTQHFNTTDSMGRLTLNILLSFAQFEREIISERTRDKIAAARRKGKWMGGKPLLGYDLLIAPGGSKLIVNEDEAGRVRAIFELYLEHERIAPVLRELDRRAWRTKAWTTRKGKPSGGTPFDKVKLFRLLTNPAYLGKVRHHHELYDGEHDAIVDAALWRRVQAVLGRNGRTARTSLRPMAICISLRRGVLYP